MFFAVFPKFVKEDWFPMATKSRFIPMVSLAVIMLLAAPAIPHGHSEHQEGSHAGTKDTMKSQHERMANFKEATEMLYNGIIHSSRNMVQEGAEKLERSLAGHEQDMPHKNRARAKEFHGLFVELEKRTATLKTAIQATDLPQTAVGFGRILQTCATCHRKFRD